MSLANPPPQPPDLPTPRQMRIFRQAMFYGLPRDQIARQSKLRPATIDRYIHEVEQWLALQAVSLETLLISNVHLERLEHQWSESMAAWNRSKEAQQTIKAVTDKDGAKRAEQTHKSSAGDVRYLEQARRALADIRALLGIQQIPTEEELADDVQSLTFNQRVALLDRLLKKLGHAAPTEADVSVNRRRTAAAEPRRQLPHDAA